VCVAVGVLQCVCCSGCFVVGVLQCVCCSVCVAMCVAHKVKPTSVHYKEGPESRVAVCVAVGVLQCLCCSVYIACIDSFH